jgi:hypothetical protein
MVLSITTTLDLSVYAFGGITAGAEADRPSFWAGRADGSIIFHMLYKVPTQVPLLSRATIDTQMSHF